jgi:hypothetical protein
MAESRSGRLVELHMPCGRTRIVESNPIRPRTVWMILGGIGAIAVVGMTIAYATRPKPEDMPPIPPGDEQYKYKGKWFSIHHATYSDPNTSAWAWSWATYTYLPGGKGWMGSNWSETIGTAPTRESAISQAQAQIDRS